VLYLLSLVPGCFLPGSPALFQRFDPTDDIEQLLAIYRNTVAGLGLQWWVGSRRQVEAML